jgi:hypothetical protein
MRFRIFTTIAVMLLLVASLQSAAAAAFLGGSAITVGPTPTALVTGQSSNLVQRVTIRVIPGYGCKVYVGGSALNRATYYNIYAVLFPNSSGGWSEEWTLTDPRGGDGIDVSQIYVADDCSGEQVTLFYFQTGVTLGSVLHAYVNVLATNIVSNSTTAATVVSFRVLPGYVGKVSIRANSALAAVLYPDTGNPYQDSARAERFEIEDAQTRLKLNQLTISPDVPGEGLLVTAWTI